MEQIEAIKALLLRFPQWGEQPLLVDTALKQPEGCALYSLGLQILSLREDVLGNQKLRLRQSFLLRRVCYGTQQAAAWLLSFQQWLLRQDTADLEQVFGPGLRIWAEQGKHSGHKQPGIGMYEVKIHAQYEKEK